MSKIFKQNSVDPVQSDLSLLYLPIDQSVQILVLVGCTSVWCADGHGCDPHIMSAILTSSNILLWRLVMKKGVVNLGGGGGGDVVLVYWAGAGCWFIF